MNNIFVLLSLAIHIHTVQWVPIIKMQRKQWHICDLPKSRDVSCYLAQARLLIFEFIAYTFLCIFIPGTQGIQEQIRHTLQRPQWYILSMSNQYNWTLTGGCNNIYWWLIMIISLRPTDFDSNLLTSNLAILNPPNCWCQCSLLLAQCSQIILCHFCMNPNMLKRRLI